MHGLTPRCGRMGVPPHQSKSPSDKWIEISCTLAGVSCMCRCVLASHQRGDAAHSELFGGERCRRTQSLWCSSPVSSVTLQEGKRAQFCFCLCSQLKAGRGIHSSSTGEAPLLQAALHSAQQYLQLCLEKPGIAHICKHGRLTPSKEHSQHNRHADLQLASARPCSQH